MEKKQALFIRLDRMGDLVLTLPCDQLVSDTHNVHWITPKGLDFVVENVTPKKSFQTLSRDWSWQQFKELRKIIKEINPDISVCFHVPWWINFTLWFCGVKTRGGVLSQWHSYLFLNKGLRQKRSQCEYHEMEYNYLLVEHCFDLKINREKWKPVELNEPAQTSLPVDEELKYFVVHPGMGGSALNWPTQQYVELINELTEKATVVVTGTQSDEHYLTPIKKQLNGNSKVVWLDKQLKGSQLLKLLKHSIATIAPSTGVIHLSASLGVASLGIYSPIKVHQAKRWGPKGRSVETYTPQVSCPAHFECLKKECPRYFCMDSLSVKPVVEKALSHL